MGIVQWLLSWFTKPAPPVIARPDAPLPATAKPVVATKAFIGREEIIDGRCRIVGYRLAPRSLEPGGKLLGEDLLAALLQDNIPSLAARRLVFLPINPAEWQTAEFQPLLAAKVVLLLTAPMPSLGADQLVLARQITEAGGRIAIAGSLLDDRQACAMADYALLDLQAGDLPAFEDQCQRLRQSFPRVSLLAAGVETWAEHRFCQARGIASSLGRFALTEDNENSDGHLSQSRLAILEMLNLLRSEADPSALAGVVKRDPALAIKLLEMANSPLFGLSTQVASLEQAIMLLGRESLYRCLALSLFSVDADGGRDATLQTVALCRAHFLEALALPTAGKQVADELFLVGLLSLIHALLDMPLAQILARMKLPAAVTAVLLANDGPYVKYLLLAIAMERSRLEQAVSLAASLQIDANHLVEAYRRAQQLAA